MGYEPSFHDDLRSDIQPSYTDSLAHHGIKGMHWGVRRPRNEDGIIQGAGAKLAKKQKKLRAKARENNDTARFAKKMADSIQRDANIHGQKARVTNNILKKAGHRAAQAWDNNTAEYWRNGAKSFTKTAAKQTLKADRIKAKRELQDWGEKANARYAKDAKYRKSGQLGVEAEQAVAKQRAANKAAKSRYKQTVNADRIRKAKGRAGMSRSIASANRNAASRTNNRVVKSIYNLNDRTYSGIARAYDRRANRLGN